MPARATQPSADAGRAEPFPRARRALATGTALIVAGVLPGFLTASQAPRIRSDFAFGDSALGLAVAAFYLVSMVASSPAGSLVDRVGPVRGMRLAAAVLAVACAGVALLAQSAASLTLVLVVAGVGNALAGPAVGSLLKLAVSDRRHGVAFGAQQAGAPAGALLAGLALPLIAIPLDWRVAFVGAGALGLVAVALAPAGAGLRAATAGQGGRRTGVRPVHALAVAAALASAAGVGLVSFLVLYAIDVGIGEAAAGLLLGGVSLAATISRIVLGERVDRSGVEPLRPVVPMLGLSAVGYLALTPGTPALVVAGALVAGGIGWAWPGALTHAVVRRSPAAPAWAVGVMMTGLFAGAVGGPLVVGLLAGQGAFAVAWVACAGFAVAAAAVVAAAERMDDS